MDRNGSIEDFSTVTLRAIKFFQQYVLKRAPATWVPLVASYPQQKVPEASFVRRAEQGDRILKIKDFYYFNPFADMVTYTLKYQCPAGFKEPFGKQRMRGPQHRETLESKETPGLFYDIVGLPMDNLVQFDCWSSDGRGVDNLAAWFKSFMQYMKGPIMAQGFSKIEFWERAGDKDITKWRDDIAVASLQYYVRTEEMYAVPTSLVTQINQALSVRTSLEEESDLFAKAAMTGIPVSGIIDSSMMPILPGVPLGTTQLLEHGDF
jgi:hypothetical protein